MDREVYKSFKDQIQQYLDLLWDREKRNEFFVWTESDVQSYLYSCLVRDYGDRYSINTNPVLTSTTKMKYKGRARSVKPFYQPDILISPVGNLKVEQESWSSEKKEKRMALRRKDESILIEIKFVQDTNSSWGRKSKSKLRKLTGDYEKIRRENHKHIILVFVEKGEKSYLYEADIKGTLGKKRKFVVFHKPRATMWD